MQLVTFLHDQIAVGDEHLALTLDHDDDRLAGDIQIADALAHPAAVLEQDDFLEVDVLVVAEGLGAQHQHIAHLQMCAAARHDDPAVSLDGGNNGARGQLKIGDGLARPGVLFFQKDLEEVDVLTLHILAHALDARILIDETCGNNTGGDGDHAHAKERDADGENASYGGDGVDIAVADRPFKAFSTK